MPDRESPRAATAPIIGEVAVFCTLSLLGGGLFALVALTNIDWFYPTLFYGAVVYVAAQRYFYSGGGSPELDLEDQRAQDTTVQTYLDQMTYLLLKEKLRAQPQNSDVYLLARARTITVLQRIDGERKRGLVLFLYESGFVEATVFSLLRYHADLQRANLAGLNLSHALLNVANLREADLSEANLHGADLRRADLSEANLSEADLGRTDLSEANLRGANLSEANLHGANLRRARGVTNDELELQAKSLKAALMPDGHKYED